MNNSRILINNLKIFQGINQNIINVLLILFGTLLLTISAKVQVPFWPVPMTMQTFVVFIIGMSYGWRLAFATLKMPIEQVKSISEALSEIKNRII